MGKIGICLRSDYLLIVCKRREGGEPWCRACRRVYNQQGCSYHCQPRILSSAYPGIDLPLKDPAADKPPSCCRLLRREIPSGSCGKGL
jgi:hypothetical protein